MTRTKRLMTGAFIAVALTTGIATPAVAGDHHTPLTPLSDNHMPLTPLSDNHTPVAPFGDHQAP
ncbi:hypothetical protein ACIHCQ_22830 [Streptomyces sp. NPDC052236]|uniref:hypothetical protein n=1 Tax=Streptomyces sp. NPDC052236 TaxID=3365686 RepID=UPI0037D31C22